MGILPSRLDLSPLDEKFSISPSDGIVLEKGNKSLKAFLRFVSNRGHWEKAAQEFSTKNWTLFRIAAHPFDWRWKRKREGEMLAHIDEWVELALSRNNNVYRLRLDLQEDDLKEPMALSRRGLSLIHFSDLLLKNPLSEPAQNRTFLRKWATHLEERHFRIYLNHVSTTSTRKRAIASCERRKRDWELFGSSLQGCFEKFSKIEQAVAVALIEIAKEKEKEADSLKEKISASPIEYLELERKRVVNESIALGLAGGLLGLAGGVVGAVAGFFLGGLVGSFSSEERLEETKKFSSQGLEESREIVEKSIPFYERGGSTWNLKEITPVDQTLAVQLGIDLDETLYIVAGTKEYVWVNHGEAINRWDRADLSCLQRIKILNEELEQKKNAPVVYDEKEEALKKNWVYGEYTLKMSKVHKRPNCEKEVEIFQELEKLWNWQRKLDSAKENELKKKKEDFFAQRKEVCFLRVTVLNRTGQSTDSADFKLEDSSYTFLSMVPGRDVNNGGLEFLQTKLINGFRIDTTGIDTRTQVKLAYIPSQKKYIWILDDLASSNVTWTYLDQDAEKKIKGVMSVPESDRSAYWEKMKVRLVEQGPIHVPLRIRYVSKWDSKEFLDDNRASLTLLSVGSRTRCGMCKKTAGHAMLCYEGVRDGLPFTRYAHLTKDSNVEIEVNKKGTNTPLWVWEFRNERVAHKIRIRSKPYFVDGNLVKEMDQRITEHTKQKKVSFSMTAPWWNYYQCHHKTKKARSQGRSWESCISYAAWMARAVIPELPEPDRLNPDEYIKKLNEGIVYQ